MTTPTTPDYIRPVEAARLAGLHRQGLMHYTKNGVVPGAVMIAGYWLYDRDVFTPWAEERLARKKARP